MLVHETGAINWASSFRLAFIFGIALPWIHEWENNILIHLDKSLYATIKKWASDDLHSVNAQIESLLLVAVKNAGRWKTESDTKRD
jgi:hypothetical protein